MSRAHSNADPESMHLRDLSPTGSVLSDDFDRLLSEDEFASDSDLELDFNQNGARNLPPVDGGRHALTFLAATWMLEACGWGFPLAFGVFQSYYSADPLFGRSEYIPTIGTLATGVSYLGMPFTNAIILRWPQYQRHMCFIGWLLCLIGLVGASFATEVWHLLFFQGFVYGLGWVVCYTPFLFMLNGWFVEKRGLAYGILFAASGVSGLIIPLGLGAILDRYGFRLALRAYAIVMIMLSGPGFLLIKPRIPGSTTPAPQSHRKEQQLDSLRRVVKTPHFLIFAAAIFLQGLSFFLPNIFLPSFAQALELSQTKSNSLLALLSLSQVVGQVAVGYVSDHFNPYYPITLSTLSSGLAAIFLWGPAKGMNLLVPMALLWGFWSSSYSVLYTSMCSYSTADHALSMTVYGIFSFERGIANVLEGPISGWLLGEEAVETDEYALHRYQGVVWYTAICMLVSSLGGFGLFIRKGR